MKVQEIMRRIVHTVRAQATIEDASKQMLFENIGLLPVVEEAWKEASQPTGSVVERIGFLPVVEEDVMVGVLTTRDIVIRAIAQGKDPATTPVSEIMTHDFACCYEDNDVSEALAILGQRKVRRLFVLNRDDNLVGIISRGDILAAGSEAP
jgi:predicted transcriptional regulator